MNLIRALFSRPNYDGFAGKTRENIRHGRLSMKTIREIRKNIAQDAVEKKKKREEAISRP